MKELFINKGYVVSTDFSTDLLDALAVVDLGNLVVGALKMEKTPVHSPVDGIHYLILSSTPSSVYKTRILKSNLEKDDVESITFRDIVNNAVDTDETGLEINRRILLRGSNKNFSYLNHETIFSDLVDNKGRGLFLFLPGSFFEKSFCEKLTNSIKNQGD